MRPTPAYPFSIRFVIPLLCLSLTGSSVLSQEATTPAGPSPEAAKMEQEEQKARSEKTMLSSQALDNAEILLKSGEFDKAEERLDFVLKNTEATGSTQGLYQQAQVDLGRAYLGRVQLAVKDGNFGTASEFLEKARPLLPNDKEFKDLEKQIDRGVAKVEMQRRDPQSLVNNPAVTPEFVEKVATVQRLLFEGDRFFDTGQYDKADKQYRRALVIDAYNKAARARLERLERYKTRIASIAHETTRQEAMYEVNRRWHDPEKPEDLAGTNKEVTSTSESNIARITAKLTSIKIPEIAFNDTPVEDAIRFLGSKARELDPLKEGINFVPKLQATVLPTPPPAPGQTAAAAAAAAQPAPAAPRTITLNLSNVSLDEALRLLTNLCNLKYKVEEYAVLILPSTETSEVLITRTFNVPPGFFQGGLAATPAPTGGVRAGGGTGSTVDTVKVDVKQQLSDQGVDFPSGSTAAFLAGSSKLVVKDTPEQMDIIDALIQSRQVEDPLIEIETKYVEFTDDALKELSFNWAFNSASKTPNLTTLPFIQDATGALAAPTNTSFTPDILTLPPNSSGRQTAGATALRTQNFIPNNSLDAILRATSVDNTSVGTTATANQLLVGAVVGNRAFGLLANLIDQVHGVDLLSAPKVMTKSHSQAKVEIIRKMRYPKTFEAPKFNGTPVLFDGQPVLLIAPPNPSDWETEDIGVVLDVTPTAYPDRRIDLELKPKVTDFEGFVNYGSVVNEGSTVTDQISTVSTYRIPQPVFNNRSITTKVQVIDGQTVVMGGLVREDRQEINDKVPLLGDIPYAGRLFRSSITKTLKRNLVVFVTARLIRPTGKPRFIQDTEETPAAVMTVAPADAGKKS